MFLFLLLFIILFLLLSGGADASPLLAGGNTVTGYVAVIVTFAALVAMGIFFGKRDRAKIKADLIPKVKTPSPHYQIRECWGPVTGTTFEVRVFTYSAWCPALKRFSSLHQAELYLLAQIEADAEASKPKLTHEYLRDGTPVPPAPALPILDKSPATLGDA